MRLTVVHIKDEFFENMDKKIPKNGLMKNKEHGHSRPTLFFPHPENKDLVIAIPMSTQNEKYEGIVDNKKSKKQFTQNLVIIETQSKKDSILIQNMYPLRKKDIAHLHREKNGIIRKINDSSSKTIVEYAKLTYSEYKKGEKVLFTKFNAMEKVLLKEIELERKPKNIVSEKLLYSEKLKNENNKIINIYENNNNQKQPYKIEIYSLDENKQQYNIVMEADMPENSKIYHIELTKENLKQLLNNKIKDEKIQYNLSSGKIYDEKLGKKLHSVAQYRKYTLGEWISKNEINESLGSIKNSQERSVKIDIHIIKDNGKIGTKHLEFYNKEQLVFNKEQENNFKVPNHKELEERKISSEKNIEKTNNKERKNDLER